MCQRCGIERPVVAHPATDDGVDPRRDLGKVESGKVTKLPEVPESSGEVVDLLAALQRSVAAAKSSRGETEPGPKPTKKSPGKKTAAKKPTKKAS
ncbi:MAG: hypothetical protein QM655_05515 [Nocardioidaceae bacterium]